MKRFAIFLAFLFLVFLSGCDLEPQFSPHYFSSVVTVKDENNNKFTAKLISSEGENITISMIAPDNVNGIQFIYKNGELTQSMGDLSCITDKEYLPAFSFASNLYYIITNIKEPATYKGSRENMNYFVIPCDKGKINIVCSLGEIKHITTDFSNYIYDFETD